MISAVVCTARGGETLENCITSMRRQSLARIVVVHSYPLSIQHSDIHYIYTRGYYGYAYAVNVGLSVIPNGDVLILNDDVFLEPDCVASLKAASRDHDILQPQILLYDQPEYLENAGHWLHYDGGNIARGRGRHRTLSLPESILVFSGAAVLLSRAAILRVGAFDEDLFSFGEDLDWSLRALRLGFRIRYVAQARVRHKLGGSHGRDGFQKGLWVERNRILAAIRSMPLSTLIAQPLHTVQRLSWLGIGAVRHKGVGGYNRSDTATGALRGIGLGYKKTRQAWRKRVSDQKHWVLKDDDFLNMLHIQQPPLRDIWHPHFL